MNYKYSERVTRILGYSKEEALRLNNDYIGPEHLMLGLIRDGESRAIDILRRKFYVNIPSVKEVLERTVRDYGPKLLSTDIALDQRSSTIMRLTVLEARLLKSDESDAEHMLLAILKQHDNVVARILNDCDVTYKDLYESLSTKPATTQIENSVDFDEEDEDEEGAPPPSANDNHSETASSNSGNTTTKTTKKGNSDTPAIDKFGFDLTRAAADGTRRQTSLQARPRPGPGTDSRAAVWSGTTTRLARVTRGAGGARRGVLG